MLNRLRYGTAILAVVGATSIAMALQITSQHRPIMHRKIRNSSSPQVNQVRKP